MFFQGLFISLFVALLLVAVLALIFGQRGPWGGLLWLFLVIFFGAWAMGLWARPVGPMIMGVSWVPFLIGAVAFALLLLAIAEAGPRPASGRPAKESGEEVAATVGIFFWLLILLLMILIVVGAFWTDPGPVLARGGGGSAFLPVASRW